MKHKKKILTKMISQIISYSIFLTQLSLIKKIKGYKNAVIDKNSNRLYN